MNKSIKYFFSVALVVIGIAICVFYFSYTDRFELYLNIDNPRKAGELIHYLRYQGKIVGESSSPGPDTLSIPNYLCAAAIFGINSHGDVSHIANYRTTKGGTFGGVSYVKNDLKQEKGIGPNTSIIIDATIEFKEFIFILRSISEETGLRVFRIDRKLLLKTDETSPVRIPDLKSLPMLNEVSEAEKLQRLYNETKKWNP